MKYEDRIVCFIDILGFKSIINRTVDRDYNDIESEIKESHKKIKYLVREYNKLSNNFETKNKHLIKDFDIFINEFQDILIEKVKSSEEQILKAYVQMAIKAVAREVLKLKFPPNELKIK